MKKFVLVLLAFLAMPLFAEGFDESNVFADVEGPNGKYFCATMDKSSFPEEAVKAGVTVVIMAYNPSDSTMYLIPFLNKNDAADFIGVYTALADGSSQFGLVLTSNGIYNLICDYVSKRNEKFPFGGVMFCWTEISAGSKRGK